MNETIKSITHFIDINFIYCLFPIIITIVLVELLFKSKFKTKETLNIIRWFIIIYAIYILILFFITIFYHTEETAFIKRATGKYWWSYWIMFICSTILPFTLLIKKLSNKPFYILLVGSSIRVGRLFELLVITTAAYHRSIFVNDIEINWYDDLIFAILMLFLQGIFIAFFLLAISELISKRRNVKSNSNITLS